MPTMKALVWEAPRTMNVRDVLLPDVATGEVLIKVAYAGICGSELSGYLGHNALRVPPLVMGHEFSGEIVELGAEVTRQYPLLEVGLNVTVNPLYCTADSELQRRGLDQLCPTRQLLGAHRPGAFAEYVTVPARTVSVLPGEMPLRTGALTEPTACGVRIGSLCGDVRGIDVLILGAGPIGLMVLQVLQRLDAARIYIADIDRERLAMAGELGGQMLDALKVDIVAAVREITKGTGVSIAVDAVGTSQTREQCIAATMTTGMVVLSGLHEESSMMPAADIIRREIVVRGAFAYTPLDFSEALTLLDGGEIRPDRWIVEAPLEEGGRWFERLIEAPGDVSKVLLRP